MEGVLPFIPVGIGMLLAYVLASRKGLNVTGYVIGALVISIVAVPFAIFRKPSEARRSAVIWTPTAVLLTAAYFGSIVFALAFVIAAETRRGHVETIDKILTGDPRSATLRVNHLELPMLVGMPAIGPADYKSYFTVRKAAGVPIPPACDFETFDVHGRLIQDGSYSLTIDGPDMERLRPCNGT